MEGMGEPHSRCQTSEAEPQFIKGICPVVNILIALDSAEDKSQTHSTHHISLLTTIRYLEVVEVFQDLQPQR